MAQEKLEIAVPPNGIQTSVISAIGAPSVEAKVAMQDPVTDQPGVRRKTVLVVAENDSSMMYLRNLLELFEYDILHTADGMEGLKLARQHHPDLILMDTHLPVISGLEVSKWIKEDDDLKSIPVIATTAIAVEQDQEAVLKVGCEACSRGDVNQMIRTDVKQSP